MTDSNGNFLSNPVGVVPGASATWTSLEASFHQDLNGDGVISAAPPPPPPPPPPSGTVIESFGSTSLTQIGNTFHLGNGSGPLLKSSGAAFAAGSAGGWTPIGVEQTASGFEVAWKVVGSDQYGVWMTDSNGNFMSNSVGVVSGNSTTWTSLEASFHQDLNGDGVIGTATPLPPPPPPPPPSGTVIESFGSTDLTLVGSNFYLYDSNGSGPTVKSGGVAFVAGSAGGWTPIGAEHTASGYEVAWKVAGSDQYGIWLTDNNGNFLSNPVGVISGNSTTWTSLEASFHQDLNGDGVIGGSPPLPPPSNGTVIEFFGSTSLTQVGSTFYFYDVNQSGPSLKLGGAAFVAGSAAGWAPIGVEQTASGYEVAWKVTGSDQYGIWLTDNNGNFLSNPVGVVSGSSTTWKSLEASFHQDLNGDGVITGAGPAPANIVSGTVGNDTITSAAANEVFFGNGGNNTFAFTGSFGKDVIADFQPNNDVLQLNHSVFADFASVLAHSAQVGPDVIVTVDAADLSRWPILRCHT